MRFVLDASIAIRWCLLSQQTEQSRFVLNLMGSAEIFAPGIWPVEIASVISREVNQGTISLENALEFFQLLSEFNIQIAKASSDIPSLFKASRRHRLRAYDVTYLELALELGLPLATADNDMRAAAIRANISLVI